MLRPVDEESGFVGDVDGTTLAQADQAVLQTGGDATVSTA